MFNPECSPPRVIDFDLKHETCVLCVLRTSFMRLFMSREKLSVWIGLCGNGELIGPFFFDGNVNGEAYLQMLNDQIVRALAERYVLQANGTFLRVWWAQDGTLAHRRIMVMERLQQLFLDRIISLGRDHEWPPRSPDLTPLEFFCLGLPQKQSVPHSTS